MTEPTLGERASQEAREMAREGLRHPSARPVLTAGAIGAVAGLVLPGVSLVAGALIGAGVGFWRRIAR